MHYYSTINANLTKTFMVTKNCDIKMYISSAQNLTHVIGNDYNSPTYRSLVFIGNCKTQKFAS